MPMSEEELRLRLAAIEPQYEALSVELGPSDLPALRAIAGGDDLGLATKAIYLASLVEDEAAQEIVVEAAGSGEELKRIAAGSALPNLRGPRAEQVALRLLDEPNPALAKLVLREVRDPSPALAARIRAIGESDAAPEALRSMARRINPGD